MIFNDLWTSIITQPGVGDLLALSVCIGIFLLVWSARVRPPADDQVRSLGLFVSIFSLGNMLLAVVFNVSLNFQWLEIPFPQSSPTIAAEADRDSPTSGLTKSGRHSGSLQQKSLRAGKQGAGKEDISTQTWKIIKIWEGVNPRQTEIFSVPSARWVIDWMTMPEGGPPGNFAVKVYSADGDLVQHAPALRGRDQGSMSLERPGRYYLEITSTQKYKVLVKVTQ